MHEHAFGSSACKSNPGNNDGGSCYLCHEFCASGKTLLSAQQLQSQPFKHSRHTTEMWQLHQHPEYIIAQHPKVAESSLNSTVVRSTTLTQYALNEAIFAFSTLLNNTGQHVAPHILVKNFAKLVQFKLNNIYIVIFVALIKSINRSNDLVSIALNKIIKPVSHNKIKYLQS